MSDISEKSVWVRMYGDVLGDCFLLGFPSTTTGATFHMLIDAGILHGTPDATERARRIMSDIVRTTRRIDVLVVTHEHWDHLSCFQLAAQEFGALDIGELWLAWTEDRRDEQARRLREGREKAMKVIDSSFDALSALLEPDADPSFGDDEEASTSMSSLPLNSLTGLIAFAGADRGDMIAASQRVNSIIDQLRQKAERVKFLQPGSPVISVGGADGLNVYVLGPPRDEVLLRRSRPRKRAKEVYELSADSAENDVFLVAALGSGQETATLALPFSSRELIELSAADGSRDRTFFENTYQLAKAEWRKIDTDWLGAAETLALRLDSDTNNTSLALALEIQGKVLLFPGDAQVGSWLSWAECVWPPGSQAGQGGIVTMPDLFARTVIYKVGHHGSHNATLRGQGLELMTHPGLVAFLPVNEEFAREVKKWNMPFPSLRERLEQKTGGRIIRGDRGKADLEEEARRRAGGVSELSRADWDAFLAHVDDVRDAQGKLAIQYRLTL